MPVAIRWIRTRLASLWMTSCGTPRLGQSMSVAMMSWSSRGLNTSSPPAATSGVGGRPAEASVRIRWAASSGLSVRFSTSMSGYFSLNASMTLVNSSEWLFHSTSLPSSAPFAQVSSSAAPVAGDAPADAAGAPDAAPEGAPDAAPDGPPDGSAADDVAGWLAGPPGVALEGDAPPPDEQALTTSARPVASDISRNARRPVSRCFIQELLLDLGRGPATCRPLAGYVSCGPSRLTRRSAIPRTRVMRTMIVPTAAVPPVSARSQRVQTSVESTTLFGS